ncbi:MAG: hypothetical protein WDO15_29390 [Bacteroidota bacterium]
MEIRQRRQRRQWNAITGTPMNSPTFSTDSKQGGYSLVLNGTTQYIDFGNPSQVPIGTNARSISVWAKTGTHHRHPPYCILWNRQYR